MKTHAASSSEALPPNRTASHSGKQQCSQSPSPAPPTSHKQNQPIVMTHKALSGSSHVPKTASLNRWYTLFPPGWYEAATRTATLRRPNTPPSNYPTCRRHKLQPVTLSTVSTSMLAVTTGVFSSVVPASLIFIYRPWTIYCYLSESCLMW